MKIFNKRASYDYELLDHFEAGIRLEGQEVKAVRLGHADLTGSFARVRGNEVYLINAKIYPYEFARTDDYDQKRTRKLLLHKKEIIALKTKTDGTNLTIVPLSMYTTPNLVKVSLALGKPKKKVDKKEVKRRKDMDRDIERTLKDFGF